MGRPDHQSEADRFAGRRRVARGLIPVTMSAWVMLQRNLLYTAVTRAKKLVVLVGAKKAIAQAVRVAGAGRRHTALDHRLTGA
jgi:exodeoxyribonuclease V alpha subunit